MEKKDGKAIIRGLASELDMDRRTMERLVKDDLGLKSFKRTLRQTLKPIDREKWVICTKKCLNVLKKKPAEVVILHLDETPFSLGEMVTSETGYYLAGACGDADDSTIHYGKERHFANLQVIAVVSSDNQKCDLIFLEAGEGLDSAKYVDYLKQYVFPGPGQPMGSPGSCSVMELLVILRSSHSFLAKDF